MMKQGPEHSIIARRNSYFSLNRYFIASHMQPTFFRRVCPSYDEPQFKARFSLVLRYNQRFKSISNTPQQLSLVE
jgi:aminopeptidase N